MHGKNELNNVRYHELRHPLNSSIVLNNVCG
jgi:hypothetical protein